MRKSSLLHEIGQNRLKGPLREPAQPSRPPLPHPAPGTPGRAEEAALPAQAGDPAATAWALSSAEVFDLLTRDLGWSEEQYVAWLSGSLVRLLLP